MTSRSLVIIHFLNHPFRAQHSWPSPPPILNPSFQPEENPKYYPHPHPHPCIPISHPKLPKKRSHSFTLSTLTTLFLSPSRLKKTLIRLPPLHRQPSRALHLPNRNLQDSPINSVDLSPLSPHRGTNRTSNNHTHNS